MVAQVLRERRARALRTTFNRRVTHAGAAIWSLREPSSSWRGVVEEMRSFNYFLLRSRQGCGIVPHYLRPDSCMCPI